MTHAEALELADFIEGLGGCESVRIKPGRHGWALIVRMVALPPRTFTRYGSAFATYCGGPGPDDEEPA